MHMLHQLTFFRLQASMDYDGFLWPQTTRLIWSDHEEGHAHYIFAYINV